ncbi:3D domain-containing protein [Mechercharimyces sp. CAU 1602]|uniref:3D domain-containing protein n=1 Tax=Mechercharimyces sp. CAU 1602 TaxID=2973933 RepID=UPI00216242A1|nr:3D domain-containing protein [Mechercharimyces sp. CAU 1602]MCS1350560.1 3D domain-containing protein [Mechercharimyces sp. CAU 1602]
MKKGLIITLSVVALLIVSVVVTAYSMKADVAVAFSDKKEDVEVTVLGGTVEEALEKSGYNLKEIKDKYESNIAWDEPVKNGMKISLTCRCEVNLQVGDDDLGTVETSVRTVGDLLKEQEVELGKWDQVNHPLEQTITDGMEVSVDRIEKKVKKEVKTIDYKVKKKDDDDLAKGEEKVVRAGKEGKKIYEVSMIYKNGKLVESETGKRLVKEIAAVDKEVTVGTKEIVEVASGSIEGLEYSKVIEGEATGYTATGNRTATGTVPKRGTIAVDPSVIPLGTKLYIPGYGYGVAEDTGGAVNGNIIDLFFTSRSEALQWGRRGVTIYVLK